jgi:hypothetical protein
MTERCVLEQTLLSALRNGPVERYELDEEGSQRLALVLAAVIDRPHAVRELRRLLELAVGLRKELASPAAAERIEQIVRENFSAVTLIALHILRAGALEETRAFRAREGRDEVLAAPRLDSHEEQSVKLAEFLDPASTGRIRQVSRSRRST